MTHGATIADSLQGLSANLEAYLIVSSIDLELVRPSSKLSTADIKKMLREIPRMEAVTAAFEVHGISGLRSLAEKHKTTPQTVWWCPSRGDFEGKLDGIYERLTGSPSPYDAYDFGVIGTIGWVYMWVDW